MNSPFSSMSSDPAESAKALLIHYLQNAGKGRPPNSEDEFTEISNLIDSVIEASGQSALEKYEANRNNSTTRNN
jgi:hypothetical protein